MLFVRTAFCTALVLTAALAGSAGYGQTAPPPAPPASTPAAVGYDPSIFHKSIPAADLADLTQHAGEASGTLWRDKAFRKLVNANTPDVMYHYGNDKPLQTCMDLALDG
jgi:hypothetical protein